MNNMDRFSQALCNFNDTEQEWFWQWIAKSAKSLPDEAKLRSGLCDAVGELRSGRNRPRTFTGGFRSLSRDQLHKAVLTYRERLIPFVKEYRDWKAMVARWLLATRQDQVVAVLDALGCPHDGKGHRSEDRPPYLEPEEATQRIMALSSQIPFADLEMITAGLLNNHEGWNYLDQAVDWLHEEAQRDRETVQTTAQCPVSTTMTATQFSTDPATRVQALRGQMDTLITDLQGMVAELQAGRLPDMTVIASAVEPLRTEFATLVTELRPTDESLEGLTAAIYIRAELITALAMIDRLERLRHRQNPEFVGIVQIRQRCAEVRQMVTQVTGQDEVVTEALKPLCALERLVDEYESLDEVVIEELDTAVRGQFGAQIAIAASKRNLEFAEPDAVVPAKSSETSDLTEVGKHRGGLNGHHFPQIEGVSGNLPELTPPCQPEKEEATPASQPDTKNAPELDTTPADPVTPPLEALDTNGVQERGHAAENPTEALLTPEVVEYSAVPEPPVATLLKADLANLRREDWVRLGEIQRSWLERRQPLRAWLLASEVERRLISHQIHIEDLPLLPSWACRLLLVTSDAKLPLSDEDKELLYRIRNLSGDSKELIVLWITATLLENASEKPLRVMRLVSPQQFDLPPHSLGGACVEQLLTPVFNGGSLHPLRDPADFKREFDQAIKDAQEILDRRNNYRNRWVRNFWRDLIARTGCMGQILANAKERRFPARTLSVEVIVKDLPEWSKILSEYRNNMHNRMEEFANRIEAARSAHEATQGVLQAGQSAISKQAIAEILGGIQRQTGNAWWLEVIKSGITHL
jgi:hypothetical protein